MKAQTLKRTIRCIVRSLIESVKRRRPLISPSGPSCCQTPCLRARPPDGHSPRGRPRGPPSKKKPNPPGDQRKSTDPDPIQKPCSRPVQMNHQPSPPRCSTPVPSLPAPLRTIKFSPSLSSTQKDPGPLYPFPPPHLSPSPPSPTHSSPLFSPPCSSTLPPPSPPPGRHSSGVRESLSRLITTWRDDAQIEVTLVVVAGAPLTVATLPRAIGPCQGMRHPLLMRWIEAHDRDSPWSRAN